MNAPSFDVPVMDAVVPAAGIGTRMGAAVPKQYLKITHDKTILEYTLQQLLSCPVISRIVVVLNPEDKLFFSLPVSCNPAIVVTAGGKERADSVLAGLAKVNTPWVMVHDAARPLVQSSDIQKLAEACVQADTGGILAAACADTIKYVEQGRIKETLPRECIYRAQTPQCFKTAELMEALQQGLHGEGALQQGKTVKITDEASAMEAAGHPCLVVKGRADNFKITEPEDLLMAQALLKSRAQAE